MAGEIDPTWTGEQSEAPVPTRIPADENHATLPSAPRSRAWVIGAAVSAVIALVGGLFVASETGILTLGIEHWWGASNRPNEALSSAGAAVAQANSYAAQGEVVLTWQTPPTLPVLDARAANAVQVGSGVGETTLTVRFNEQTAPEGKLIETEWLPHTDADVAQLAPLFFRDRIRLDLFKTQQSLYVRLPEVKDGGWVEVNATDLAALDLKETTWSSVLQALGANMASGSRIAGRTLDGVRVKGYTASVNPAAALATFFQSTNDAANTDALTLSTFYIGRMNRLPYALAAEGNIGGATVKGSLAFRQFNGQINVAAPTQVAKATLGDWLVSQGLIARTPAAARDAKRSHDLGRIVDALAQYATEEHPYRYPKVDGVVKLESTSEPGKTIAGILGDLPSDPLAPNHYYGYSSDGSIYRLTAVLEDAANPAGVKEGDLTLLVRIP